MLAAAVRPIPARFRSRLLVRVDGEPARRRGHAPDEPGRRLVRRAAVDRAAHETIPQPDEEPDRLRAVCRLAVLRHRPGDHAAALASDVAGLLAIDRARIFGHSMGGAVTLELLSFAALALFAGYLCTRVRAGGWLATAALAGGVIAIAVKLASFAPMLAGYVLRHGISPETARVLSDMNGAAFVVDWLPTGLFVACAAGAALAARTSGRTLGWGGVVAGTAALIVTAVTGVHVLTASSSTGPWAGSR